MSTRAHARHALVPTSVAAAALLASAAAVVVSAPAAAQRPELGEVSFPTSASGPAQERFIDGVLYLHSFQYDEALREFRAAQEADGNFAMAYWGEAMAHNHPVWFEQDTEAGRAALNRLAPTLQQRLARAPTERERDWLRAVDALYFASGTKQDRDDAYAEAMRRLADDYPDDAEFQTFYALALLGTAHEGRDIPTYMRAAAIADRVFEAHPRHPGAAHYLIHAFDDPAHAPLGLPAARAYSEIAPAASHAQHMTSHIFTALGMWDDVERANRVAYDVSGGTNFHAFYWLGYTLLQQGRDGEAADVYREMMATYADKGRSLSYPALMRAHHIVNTEDWDGEIARTPIDPAGLGVRTAAATHFVNGLAALQRREVDRAQQSLSAMYALVEGLPDDAHPAERGTAQVLLKELGAVMMLRDFGTDQAIELLREAADQEASLPFEFGPPPIVKPAPELLGEVLLGLGQPEEAMKAFQRALQRAPRRALSLEGLATAAQESGHDAVAREALETLTEIQGGQRAETP